MPETGTSKSETNIQAEKKEIAFQFTVGSLSQEVHNSVNGIIEEIGSEDKKLVQKQVGELLNDDGRLLLRTDQDILKPPETLQENEEILGLVKWLHEKDVLGSGDRFVSGWASHLNTGLYSREQLLEILDSKEGLSFIQPILRSKGDVILKGKSNEEIVDFVTGIIKRMSRNFDTGDKTFSSEADREQYTYAMSSAHSGYAVWDSAKKYINLSEDLEKTVQIGESLGDEFVWEKILVEKRNEMKALPKEKRYEMAKKIAQSIRKKRGLPNVDVEPYFKSASVSQHQVDGLGFGLQLANKMVEVLLIDSD